MAYWMIAALSGVNFLSFRLSTGRMTPIKAVVRRAHHVVSMA
jgi:hypothetical protein